MHHIVSDRDKLTILVVKMTILLIIFDLTNILDKKNTIFKNYPK